MLQEFLVLVCAATFVVIFKHCLYSCTTCSKKCFCSSDLIMENSLRFDKIGELKQFAQQRKTRLDHASKFTVKANDGKYYNLRPLMLLGMYSEKDLYLPSEQNLDLWSEEVISQLCPEMPKIEKKIVVSALETPLFQDINFHQKMQQELKTAMDDAVMDSYLGAGYEMLQRRVDDPSDLYKGSRAVADYEQVAREFVEENKLEVLKECIAPIAALKNDKLDTEQIFAVVNEVENYLDIISLLGNKERV